MEADGGSRGNPGPAGYGAVVFSADHGTCSPRASRPSGRPPTTSPNTAASSRVWRRRRWSAPTEVAVSMDSKLVVEQMSGRWKVKHPDLIELNREARGLASQFDHITFTWIPREKNKHADRLANEAMDAAAEVAADAGEQQPAPPDKVESSPPGWTGATGCADPAVVAAARADRTVGATPLFGPRQSGADRTRPAPGRRRRGLPRQPGRHCGGGQLAAAACLRHRSGGGQGAGSGCRRRRRPDRNRLRRLGRADIRRGGRRGSRSAPALAARHRRHPAGRGEFRRGARPGPAGARRGSSPSTAARPCWWCRT